MQWAQNVYQPSQYLPVSFPSNPPIALSCIGESQVKTKKLNSTAKPFKPVIKQNTDVCSVRVSNMQSFLTESKEVPTTDKKELIEMKEPHPLFKLAKEHILKNENNKENISAVSQLPATPEEEKKQIVGDGNEISNKYSLTKLLNVYRGMGNFSNHTFSGQFLKKHPHFSVVLNIWKPRYALEIESGISVGNQNNLTTFIDELDAEMKNIGSMTDLC